MGVILSAAYALWLYKRVIFGVITNDEIVNSYNNYVDIYNQENKDSISNGKNVFIEPYVVFGPKVKIGNNVLIKSFSHLESCIVKDKVEIGPYARVRPNTVLEKGSKVGNFVEIKKSKIGKNSKVNHLTYIGDANIGKNVNVGAGTITCNYDGIKKNKTFIKDNVFIGSNSSLVAPLTLEEGSTIGAGSVSYTHLTLPTNREV